MSEEKELVAPTYEIRTLNDFKKVPKKRLKACLREFAIAVELTGAVESLVGEVEHSMYGSRSIRTPMTLFRWIDDKQKTITANITIDQPDSVPPIPKGAHENE